MEGGDEVKVSNFESVSCLLACLFVVHKSSSSLVVIVQCVSPAFNASNLISLHAISWIIYDHFIHISTKVS